MFWKKEKTSDIVKIFFKWDVKIKSTIQGDMNNTQYLLESWEYTFSMLVFTTNVLWNSWQGVFKKNWNTIPITDREFKDMAQELQTFLRKDLYIK